MWRIPVLRLSFALAFGVVVGLLSRPATLLAQNAAVDVDSFRPSAFRGDLLGTATSTLSRAGQWSAGFWFGRSGAPLKLVNTEEDKGNYAIVESLLKGTVAGSVAFTPWLSAAAYVPLILGASGEEPPDSEFGYTKVGGGGLGDLRLSVKATLLGGEAEGFGLAVMEDLTFPTAKKDLFAGEAGVSGTTMLIGDWASTGWRIAGNLGYRMRKNADLIGRVVSDEVVLGAGVQAPLVCGTLYGVGSAESRFAVGSEFGNKYTNALEALGGVRLQVGDLAIAGAAGGGLTKATGMPQLRLAFNVQWSPGSGGADACGGPDGDGDGLADDIDRCPLIPGLRQFAGCPDTDNDGLPDLEDKCPKDYGPKDFQGCPDTDGDGLPDHMDKCPDKIGPKDNKGCPIGDADGDGLSDAEDHCPKEAGPKEFKGCPDTDGDGLSDKDDRCPQAPGTEATRGCPDKDGDGLPDIDDKCPDKAGDAEHGGCPVSSKTVVITKEKLVLLDKIFFESGKDTILVQSYDLLKEVARVLSEHPEVKRVRIEGHTDNKGNKGKNIKLSAARAEAVKAFILREGVQSWRLEAKGYGPTRPIASNKTDEGRAKNRRVDFMIVEMGD